MADQEKEEVVYTKPTSQVDMEARLGDDSPPPVFNEGSNPDPFNEDGFVGVSPEYANAANETDEPLEAEEGPDSDAEQAFADSYGDPESDEPSDSMKDAYGKVTRDDGGDGSEESDASATTTKTAATKKTAAKTPSSGSS
ncbi:MAG TPA: hypothetical protein VNS88_07360 [Nitrospiraceae bacterium]|nr:hypothetical protein [Nitrospiraceae bacterium]